MSLASVLTTSWIVGLLASVTTLRAQKHSTSIEGSILILHFGFVMSALLLFPMQSSDTSIMLWHWAGPHHLSLMYNHVSAVLTMLLAVVSLCVQIYSFGYMDLDRRRTSFMSLLMFFTFMMWTVIIAQNWILLFIGWEGISVSSFLLIGFIREDLRTEKASLKAIVINRIGDAALIYAFCAIISQYMTLDYFVFSQQTQNMLWQSTAFACLVAIFAKSAQWPLHVWLPNSMVAPAPVSALLHAATLVTAGVILMIRLDLIIPSDSMFRTVVQALSSWTILLMSCSAYLQSDIKKVIAYSTIAQVGYMCIAVSVGATDLALYHLWTHGFFKAQLFLIAGLASVRRHHDQEMDALKGVFSKNWVMKLCLFVGLFALAGVPGFGGFYSKERIIEFALYHSPEKWWLQWSLLIGAALTAMYSARIGAILLTPYPQHSDEHHVEHSVHEERYMQLAIIALTFCTLIAGPFGELPVLGFLNDQAPRGVEFIKQALSHGWVVLFCSIFFIIYRFFSAFIERITCAIEPQPRIWQYVRADFYFDAMLDFIGRQYQKIASWLAVYESRVLEKKVPNLINHGCEHIGEQIDFSIKQAQQPDRGVRYMAFGVVLSAIFLISGSWL